ncbi:MAG: KR domain-containing protein [Clostridia bacterium]|nr:KR domain-containing protein [Clostridia bacterium]
METVKSYIIKQVAANKLSQDEAKKMLMELKPKTGRVDEEIAIIGMACQFPDAKNTDEYWNNLASGKVCIRELPESRKKDCLAILSSPIFSKVLMDTELNSKDVREGNIQFVKQGYLDEIDKFDADFFHIPPREAKYIDPIQRVFMETAWQAIEDAGYGGEKIYGTKTGVFVGKDHTSNTLYSLTSENDQMQLTGSWAGILATRISYIFNFKGPGMVIDTACSSGAVAIHEACRALRSKECDFALAGGVHLAILHDVKGEKSSMEMVESGDSKVRTFDRKANGTVWGEGAGVIFLKPLSKAIEDGDHIYAVIKGSAINNDGTTNGITAPNAEAQEDVIVHAWRDAKVDPETISYIEAHGTGTMLGDPIEIKGLVNAFGRFTGKKQFCGIGSAKPCMGHLVGASGVASLIKVVLSLNNERIPAALNFNDPNPYINFCDSPVYVNDRLREWKKGDLPRRAGVSSFGFSGTNCHIVLEEAPEMDIKGQEGNGEVQILTVSARSESALKDYIDRYDQYFNKKDISDLRDICYTSGTGRGHFAYRIAIPAGNLDELRQKIFKVKEKGFTGLADSGIYYGYHRVVPASAKTPAKGEISEEQKGQISKAAERVFNQLADHGMNDKNTIGELCKLYTEGADIDWNAYYKGKNNKRVPIPAYPLERVRLWANTRELELSGYETSKSNHKYEHPLFDDNLESMDSHLFITQFDVRKHWVLSDHKVLGNYIVPGTTYLEMAREASTKFYHEQNIVLKNVVFITPLLVNEGEPKEVQTIVKEKDGQLEFVVASKAEDGSWIRHAEGNIEAVSEGIHKNAVNISEIIKVCPKEVIIDDSTADTGPFGFGPRWNNGRRVYIGENEMLGYFEIPAEFMKDLDEFGLHPALMDNAINMANTSIGEGLYLPLTYKVLKVYGKAPAKIYSHLRRHSAVQKNPESVTFNATLMDENGLVFAEVEDYTVKRVNEAVSKFRELSGRGGLYYETVWQEERLPMEDSSISGEHILLFKDEGNLADRLAHVLKEKGAEVTEVEFGRAYHKKEEGKFVIEGIEEDYQRLIESAKSRGISRIIHMSTIGGTGENESMEAFLDKKNRGVLSLFNLTRALSKHKFNDRLAMVLISDYATEVCMAEERINPLNNAFLSMAKVIGAEHPNIYLKSLDIDMRVNEEDIMNEILVENKNLIAAYRNGKRFVESFQTLDMGKKELLECTIKTGGVYMITGGLGGLGIEIGKYLASKAEVNICFVNRSKLPDREKWDEILLKNEDARLCKKIKAVREIEAMGAKVICASSDVACLEDMKSLVDVLKNRFGGINGIIHAAGVAGNGLIMNRSFDAFRSVTGPKMEGTWILDSLTRDIQMDFFILFSSIVSIMGGAGQGDYTAANSYLDSFAYYRNKIGKRTVSINWPSWKETGMAVDFGVNMDDVFKAISTADALSAFENILNKDIKRTIVAEPNFEHIVFQNEAALPFHISSEISRRAKRFRERHQNKGSQNSDNRHIEVKLKGREDEKYSGIERAIAGIWGNLLGIEEISIYDDFFELGGNSLLAVKLEAEMEKSGLMIEYADVSSYPTLLDLANYLEGRDGGNTAVSQSNTAASEDRNYSADNEKAAKTEEVFEMDKPKSLSGSLKILENFEPFNDMVYRGCFYSALFPVIRHFDRSVLTYLVNEMNIYHRNEDKNLIMFGNDSSVGILDVKYIMPKTLEQISQDIGIHMEAKAYSSDLIGDIVASISAGRPVIVSIDSFYESIRPDTYQKLHWPHCLVVYGFDQQEKMFNILEHRRSGSLIYGKHTISYSDLLDAYNGYLAHFGNVDITEIEFEVMRICEGRQVNTYYEFSMEEEMNGISMERDLQCFSANISELKTEMLNGLGCLEEYVRQFEAVLLDEQKLKEGTNSILSILNKVINVKRAEKYRIAGLQLKQPEIEDLLKQSIDCWDFIRTMIMKFMYTSRYKTDSFASCIEKLNRICELERQYFSKLFDSLTDEQELRCGMQ